MVAAIQILAVLIVGTVDVISHAHLISWRTQHVILQMAVSIRSVIITMASVDSALQTVFWKCLGIRNVIKNAIT